MRNQTEKENVEHNINGNVRCSPPGSLLLQMSIKDTDKGKRRENCYIDWYHECEVPMPRVFAESLAQAHNDIHLQKVVASDHPVISSVHRCVNPNAQKDDR